MLSSGMLRRVAVVITDDFEERIVFYIRMKGFNIVGTTLALTISLIFSTLLMEAISSSETSIPTRFAWRHIPEDDILSSHSREIMKVKEKVKLSP
jgi:hypothetical protein